MRGILPTLACILFLLIQCSTDNTIAGSSVSGNGFVVGTIENNTGDVMSNVQVFLIPHDYNPVLDQPLPDSLKDTTDNKGQYTLLVSNTTLLYNIEAVHCFHRTRLLLTGIIIQTDTTYAPTGILNDAGVAEVILSDTVDTINGYLYLAGTTVYKSLKHTVTLPDDKIAVYLDSIPQASFSTINYIKVNDPESQVSLVKPFVVESNDTVLVGDTIVWKSYTEQNSGLPDNEIRAIAIETDGTIWFATGGSGVVSLINTTWTVYDRNNSDLPSNNVNDILQDQTGTLWFATDSGVVSFQQGNMAVYTKENSDLLSNEITGIDEDSEGTIWFSSFDGGVASFDGNTWTIFWQNIVLPLDDVFDVAIDIGDTVWSATEEGVVKFKDGNYDIYDKSNSGLVSDSVLSVFIDDGRSKWFGQLSGIIRLNRDETDWDYFDRTDSPVLDGTTNILCEDSQGNLYIGTTKGLTLYNGRQWRDYVGKRFTFLRNKEITALTFDAHENIWIGTKSDGVIVIGLYRWK